MPAASFPAAAFSRQTRQSNIPYFLGRSLAKNNASSSSHYDVWLTGFIPACGAVADRGHQGPHII
jgi:hypothetical protein